jgi:citrate synthase
MTTATDQASSRNAVLDMEVPRGLKGMKVAQTSIGNVRGQEGFFHYRQYDATELASKRTLEDIWHLMHEGELPATKAESDAYRAQAGKLRMAAWTQVEQLVPGLVAGADKDKLDVMGTLRALIAAVGAREGWQSWLDLSEDEIKEQCSRAVAITAVGVAAIYRVKHGKEMVAPDASLPHTTDYLRMVTGETPTAEKAEALEKYLDLTVDHGFNASTFTARVVASTGADVSSSVVAAIGSLSGPLHGGAPSRALSMVDEIGTKENAEPFVRAIFERGDRLMGFGHPVYTTMDPRSVMLGEIADGIGGAQVELARHVEQTCLNILEELKPGRGLKTNVEFYAALVMRSSGIPDELFTPTFAVSRVIGWTANIREQVTEDNRIFRPSAEYIGKDAPQPVPALG